MSCIDVNVTPLLPQLESYIDVNVTPLLPQLDGNCNVTRIGDGLKASVKGIGERIIAGVRELSGRLNANVANISEGLNVRCSIVCSLTDVGYYLEVSPADIQWITDDMGVFFDVESNVDWTISAEEDTNDVQLISNDSLISNNTLITNGYPDISNAIEILENSTVILNEIMFKL